MAFSWISKGERQSLFVSPSTSPPYVEESQKENGNYYNSHFIHPHFLWFCWISKGERQSIIPNKSPTSSFQFRESQKENGNPASQAASPPATLPNLKRRTAIFDLTLLKDIYKSFLWISKGERQSENFFKFLNASFTLKNLKRRTAMFLPHRLRWRLLSLLESQKENGNCVWRHNIFRPLTACESQKENGNDDVKKRWPELGKKVNLKRRTALKP